MKANDIKRSHAERLFLEEGYSLKLAAETVGISETTVGTWCRKYDWKNRKNVIDVAPHKIKELLLEQLSIVAAGGKPTFNSDDLAKITRSLERVDKKVSTQMVISIMMLLDQWLLSQEIDPKLLEQSLKLHKQFIHHQIDLG